jgi:hypothetical protein
VFLGVWALIVVADSKNRLNNVTRFFTGAKVIQQTPIKVSLD